MQEDMRRQGSLDEPAKNDQGEGHRRFDDAVFRQELERLDDADSGERERERQAAVRAAISSIENERKRQVLEMTWDGRPAEAIAAELDTSVANVYQLRKRGMDLVKELLDDQGTDHHGDD
jgi:DNA-directed RNA polymerase specialized sigma24 family protein